MPNTPCCQVDLILFKAPPKCICNWMFESHTCNFYTVLTVDSLKTKAIYSFSDKRCNLAEVCKIQACTHLCMAQCPWCWVQLFVWCTFVEWCYLPMQSCSSSCEQVSTRCLCEQVPLQLLCTCAESRPCLWGVCPAPSELLGLLAGHPSALTTLNWFTLKQRGSIHLFCIALGCEPRLGPVCCSCDLREWIFLFKFGVFETP